MEPNIQQISPPQAAAYIAASEEYESMRIDGSPEPCEFQLPDIPCYGAFSNEGLIAVYVMRPYLDGHIVHFQISSEYKRLSHAVAAQFIAQEPAKLYARIPARLRAYINFCKKLGFQENRVLSNAYTVRGENHSWRELVRTCHGH